MKSVILIESLKTGEVVVGKDKDGNPVYRSADDPPEGDGWRPGAPGFPPKQNEKLAKCL